MWPFRKKFVDPFSVPPFRRDAEGHIFHEDYDALERGKLILTAADHNRGTLALAKARALSGSEYMPEVHCGLRAAVAAEQIAKESGLKDVGIRVNGLGGGVVWIEQGEGLKESAQSA